MIMYFLGNVTDVFIKILIYHYHTPTSEGQVRV